MTSRIDHLASRTGPGTGALVVIVAMGLKGGTLAGNIWSAAHLQHGQFLSRPATGRWDVEQGCLCVSNIMTRVTIVVN